jgi:CSLREA domain-containing protein
LGVKAATLGPAGVSFTVTSTSDAVDANLGNGVCAAAASGACTLRAAIQETNALAGADTIVLPAATYELAIPPLNQNLANVGDLDITDSLTISGAGASSTIVDGGTPAAGSPPQVHGLDRLFEVAADEATVVFSGLTLREGWAAEYGGAIMNASAATVTVVNSTLSGNGAGKTGGAIDNHVGGTLEVRSSTLRDNYASEAGSALNNNRGGALTVVDSEVASNSAADAGLDDALVGAGAISNNAELNAVGSLTVTGSRIADNSAGGGRNGAGISNDGAGTLSVTGTTFAKNRAVADGGAIFNHDGLATVAGSTFTENAGNNGGAISSSGLGSLTVADSVFTKNVAADWGGAMQNGNKGSVAIRSSTFTENTGLNGGGFGNEGSGLVTVESSTFTKNAAVDTATAVGGEGGGMHSNSGGEVVVTGGVFVENRALSGGGLSNEGGGVVTITGTRFSANRADESGGGILIQSGAVQMVDILVAGNFSDSPLEGGGGISYAGDKVLSVGETASIESSRIRDNIANGQGGGIDSRGDGPLLITTTSVTGNRAAIGGAIHHVGDAPLDVRRSTLSGNLADNGAGVFTDGDGEAAVENSTVSGNRAAEFGGGLLVSSRLTVRNATVVANAAPTGGGIDNGGGDFVGDGTVFLANSILAANTGGNCAGTMTSRGGNVENADSCQLREPSDQPGTDPLVGPLAANGGPTATLALLAGSPAQDNAACTEVDPCPSVDQRGVARPAFAGFDAGAYESSVAGDDGGGGQACAGRTERPVLADYDSWISQGAPGSNFGGDSILNVTSQSGGNQRAVVHFTLPSIPPGCELVGASLRLHSSSATIGRTLQALRIAAGWSETGVTWGNQPATTGPPASTESGLDIRELDVLSQTLAMYGSEVNGFLIRDAAENGSGAQSFHSREKGDDRPPELVLVFDDPDAPPAGGDCDTTTPLRLFADRDSWVSESSPTNNFGTDSTLKIKSQGGSNSRVFIRFPLPALAAGCTTVESATLRMEASSAKEGRSLVARPAAAAWTESGVTWANQPFVSGPASTTQSLDGPLDWDVTAGILAMYGSANNGFVIRDSDENGVGDEQTINSRHKVTDAAPELVLVFDDSTPETTIGTGPSAETEESEATFRFSSDRGDATFECSLDSAAFTACTSPHAVSELPLGTHVFEVRATRPIRAVDPTPARQSWRVADLTAPVVTLTGPPAETEETSASLEFSADEQATLACSLDGGAVAGCASPLALTALALGPHTFQVTATDASGNVGSSSLDWTIIDRTAPVVTVTGPDAETEERSAELTFSASEDAVFACSLNEVEIAGCASPQTITDLALGAYEFEVSATDGSGNVGSASVAWTVVDLTPPVVTLTGPLARTEETSATFEFSVSEEAVLVCSLDGKAVPACVSPLTRDTLRLGVHVFEVSATDPSGNTGEAVHEWEVIDETAPLVTLAGPDAETEDTSASFTFSADEPATLACSLDGIPLAACESPLTQEGLALGEHSFEVSATDASGNIGRATHDWTVVDRTAPTVTLTGPDGETEETTATFTFSASEPSTLACVLDGDELAECASPLSLSGVAIGAHVLDVFASDASGNTGSASQAWIVVDRTPPTLSLTGPEDVTELTDATLTFSANEPVAFACTLDEVVVAECASPLTVSALALGDHRFELTAMDNSGNVASVVHRWTVIDRTAPVVTMDGPAAETEETSATFTFSADEAATLACALDSVPLATCESPLTLEGLALGAHRFEVAATDPSGNAGTAVHTWSVVDRTAPAVTLTGPEAETESGSAEFAFSASEEATLACSLDGVEIADCASPISRSGLALGAHRFEVTATDASGNAGSATHLWAVVDRTAPVVTLDGPAGETEETSATFTFSASEPGTLACALDEVAVLPCESPLTRSGLLLGAHRFDVTATDASGNAASATHLWTIVDTTPPVVTLNGPPDETEDRSASFTFSATEAAALECRFDEAVFAACPSGTASYSGLALGAHRFDVRATDAAGNSASVSHRWAIVDRSQPVVTIAGPAAETSSRSATLTFAADEAVTFTCALDGATAAGCTTPVELTDLALGPHSFLVEATDSAGNVGAVTHSWKVVPPPDTSAPVITLTGPPTETNDTTARLTFSANEAVTGFHCSLDDAAAAGCTSPVDLAGLTLGEHSFRVETADLAGNAGAATHTWTIKVAPDTTPPVVTIAGPTGTTSSTSATLTFTADEPATFRCALDSESFAACESGITYSDLPLGQHVFRVEATDGALNQSVTGHSWTIVDSSAPAVTISRGPDSPTTATSATFAFSTDEPATLRCSLDGGALEACASGVTYTALAVGRHTFEVRATDAAGNVGSAGYVWSIDPPQDVTAPVVTITSGPASGTTATNATFEFSSSEPATFRCALDGGSLADCATGVSYSSLAAGPHTFQVEARDPAGNVGSATWSWTIAAEPPPAGCTSQTLTLGAAADTWLLESSASSNYGQDSTIKVDTKTGANARSLLRFQLPATPTGCTLREAKLRLYAGSSKTGRTLLAVPVASSWLEGGVTWTTQPAPTGSGVTTASGGGYVEWSVTPLVSGASGGVSFLIRDATENGNGIEQGFHSREKGTDNPPRLVVTFG